MNSQKNIQIDAVFTWVDGNDQKHIDKMMPFLAGNNSWKNKKFKTRFQQVNEIEYSVRSIIKFASFIKNIYIVTDNQTPSFLKEYNETKSENEPEIKIIDHSVIFRDCLDVLPVFNSMSIETMIYKIPDLSEHFVYFNDDFILFNPIKPSDFFIDGLPVIRGRWSKFDINIMYKSIHNRFLIFQGKKSKKSMYGYKRAQQISANIVGFTDKYFRMHHTPTALKKSTLELFFAENKNVMLQNIQYKFRNSKQFILQTLANHLEIKHKNAILKNDFQLLFIRSFKKPLFWYKILLGFKSKQKSIIFLCVQSLDNAKKEKINFIISWLNNRFA